MADKKINEVSTLTDFDYALVVKGNDVAKVSKQQLASIVGELLPNILTSLFILRGTISLENYDTTIITGMYYVQGTSSSPVISDWGGLLVLNIGSGITQVKIGYNTKSIIYRIRVSNSWSDWIQI